MKNFLVCSIVLLSIIACNDNDATGEATDSTTITAKEGLGMNVLTDQQKTEGWQLLFDGESTNGWHKYGGKPVGSAWKVADGALYLDTTIKENWQIKDGGT